MIGKGKISEQEIKELKAYYVGQPLYKHTWPGKEGDETVFIAITESVYKHIVAMQQANKNRTNISAVEEVHEAIFDSCVVWPKLSLVEKKQLPIGVMPSIAKVVQEKSGFLNVDIMNRILAPDTSTSTISMLKFWGDITTDEAEELKKDCPYPLVKVRIETCVFVIRPMTRGDLTIAGQSIDDKLSLAKGITVWPKEVDWDVLPAGWIEILGSCCTDISGFNDSPIVEEL